MKCDHYWNYPQTGPIQGPGRDNVITVRYCVKCKERQQATSGPWRKAVGDYARTEHYEEGESILVLRAIAKAAKRFRKAMDHIPQRGQILAQWEALEATRELDAALLEDAP